MRRLTVALASLALVLLWGCAASNHPTSVTAGPTRAGAVPADEAGFTAHAARRLAAMLGGAGEVRVEGPLTLGVRVSHDGSERQVNLDRLWDHCTRAPADCEPSTEDLLAVASDTMRADATPIDPSTVRAVVRTSGDLERIRRAHREAPPSVEAILDYSVAVPLIGDLWLVCVVASPRAEEWLNVDDLARLGLSKEEAVALAKRNTGAVLPSLRDVAHPPVGDGFGRLDANAHYESSRLLLHEDWAALAGKMGGRLVVAAPHSGLVIYGDAGRPGTIEAMRLAAERAKAAAERPVSSVLLEWTPEGWRPLRGGGRIGSSV